MNTTVRAPRELKLRQSKTYADAEVLEKKVSVVTYVHGGGPVPDEGDDQKTPTRKCDPVTPMRGSSVRGQLRFWWRATHGCTSPSLRAMREREDELWGNASNPGLVELSIDGKLLPGSIDVESLGPIGTGLRYGAFASKNLTKLGKDEDKNKDKNTFTVRLTVRLPQKHKQEVQDALTAWLLFGGIGGRTRRGFGAVDAEGLPKAEDFLKKFQDGNTLARVPSLHRAVLKWGSKYEEPVDAQRAALDRLQSFRQGPGIGRTEGDRTPGRSRWPEADTIRRLLRRNTDRHAPVHRVQKFPRGAFGMPIVFHFKDKDRGDPPDSHLVPGHGFDRMASPLILRPVKNGDQWGATALRLTVPGVTPGEAQLTSGRRSESVSCVLASQEAQQIQPLRQNNRVHTDVLEAFLEFFAPRNQR